MAQTRPWKGMVRLLHVYSRPDSALPLHPEARRLSHSNFSHSSPHPNSPVSPSKNILFAKGVLPVNGRFFFQALPLNGKADYKRTNEL